MKIAVCLPSRGTVYSQTVDEILRELKSFGADWEIYWSHANPIPDCFNIVTEQALKDKDVTHLWYVEEDMVLPKGILKHLMAELTENNWSVVAADYPLLQVPSATIYRDPNNQAYFSGCGCTLMTRKPFKLLKKPYWRTDIEWLREQKGDYIEVTPKWVKDTSKVYGFQDITFGVSLYLKGEPIQISSMTCGQRKVIEKGHKDNNHGHDKIVEYSDIAQVKMFTPTDDNKMIEMYNVDDLSDRINCLPAQVEYIEKYGQYKRFKHGQLVLNDENKIWEKIRKK